MGIVTIGETMVLFQPIEERPLKHSTIFSKTIGGAESNVAIGLSRLGKKARWIGRLGKDPFGDAIVSTLSGENIELLHVVRDEKHATSVYFKDVYKFGDPDVYYYRRDSASSMWKPLHVQKNWFKDATILHMTGITPALGRETLSFTIECMKMAKSLGLTVSFDPNIRFKLWDEDTAKEALLRLIPLCDIFLPGIEEAKFLFGNKEPKQLAEEILKMGPHTVAIKLGEQGAMGMRKDGCPPVVVSGEKVRNVIDTVGAGDAFASGFLSIVLENVKEFSLDEALELGNKMGAIAIQGKGDWEIFPNFEDLKGSNRPTR